MAKLKKFYTTHAANGRFCGFSIDHPTETYFAGSRDAALSGIKRKVAKLSARFFSPKPTVQPRKKVNHVAFVVDRSGSMSSVVGPVLAALNKNVSDLRAQTTSSGQETTLTVIRFDTTVENILTRHDASRERWFSRRDIEPRGGTALFDATRRAIEQLRSFPVDADEDTSYLVVTLTDGEENSSRTTTAMQLNELMRSVQATDLWTLTFLLPPGSKARFVKNYSIPDGNVAEWEQTAEGVRKYEARTTTALGQYYAARSSGQTNVKTFYSDLSAVSTKDVKGKLDDVRGQVNVWTVEKESKVREFCEKKSGKPFLKGAAFYALTKGEKKIQANKRLLVMEKGKDAVYSGDDARDVLGFPKGQTVKVVPGNHANWDVYVQSNSMNRALVRGTKVVYWPAVGKPLTEGPSAPRGFGKTSKKKR